MILDLVDAIKEDNNNMDIEFIMKLLKHQGYADENGLTESGIALLSLYEVLREEKEGR